jgi:zinc/manganese transport system substrate-binding protein
MKKRSTTITRRFLILSLTLGLSSALMGQTPAPRRVASLHPLISDIARSVAGGLVEVTDLIRPGGDIHHFEPTSSDVAKMQKMPLILASGKHLETFLPKLQDNLKSGTTILEVGKDIPSITVKADQQIFACCPDHAQNSIDPHWWHSLDNCSRAARIISSRFSDLWPEHAAAFKANTAATTKKYSQLKSWAQKEISVIPRAHRKLVTAHAAFAYFCKEYGFQSVPVFGLSREDDLTPKYMQQTISVIRDNKVKAVFPEDQANPKVLKEIVRETNVALGEPLIADGTASGDKSTVEGFFRYNVSTVVKALK